MVRHNNALPNAHLRKHWSRGLVKTYFDQPARKHKRLETRRVKASSSFPRPTHALRPVVRAQTRKYATKIRLGRGFTLSEIRLAGLTSRFARTVGIAVDHRRKNRNQESLETNVNRLKEFKAKMILYPRHINKPKKGLINDATKQQIESAVGLTQNTSQYVLPLPEADKSLEVVKITPEMQKLLVYSKLRRLRRDKFWKGKREKRAREAEESKK